jgi:hypothetical protein
VVLRNLPIGSSSGSIVHQIQTATHLKGTILHCSLVLVIYDKSCVVITVKNIEEAESLCLHWNNFGFKDKTVLRAHIHPYSSWRRATAIKSRHQIFSHLYIPGETTAQPHSDSRPMTPTTQQLEGSQLKDSMSYILSMKAQQSLI